MIIFFTLGGGTFIAVFVLMIISGMVRELSQNTNSFISENILLLVILSVTLSILGSIISAKLWGSMKAIPPMFLMFAQFFFSVIRGLYYITSDPYDSAFLTIFAMVIYIAALAFNGFVMLATAGLTCDKKRVIPLYLAGILGALFGCYFW